MLPRFHKRDYYDETKYRSNHYILTISTKIVSLQPQPLPKLLRIHRKISDNPKHIYIAGKVNITRTLLS